MKTTRRGLFLMLAGLFAGFWAARAAAVKRSRLVIATQFPTAEVAKFSEAIARLAVASKDAAHRLNELGVTVNEVNDDDHPAPTTCRVKELTVHSDGLLR